MKLKERLNQRARELQVAPRRPYVSQRFVGFFGFKIFRIKNSRAGNARAAL